MWSSKDKSLLSKSLTLPILVKSSFDSEFARTVVGMMKLKKSSNRRYRISVFYNALWYWKGDKTKEIPTKMIMS